MQIISKYNLFTELNMRISPFSLKKTSQVYSQLNFSLDAPICAYEKIMSSGTSSHPEVFCKTGVFKIFAKLKASVLYNFFEKETLRLCFVNFTKYLKAPFL